MPHRVFETDQVARYLHLTQTDVERLVKNQDIPVEKHGDRLVFRKVVIDAWASQRILGMEGRRLADYHQKSSRDTKKILIHEALLPEMMRKEYIEPALAAKTKASALREMVALAEKTGRVWDRKTLLECLEAREKLCSTGLPGGFALLHTRQPEAYLFDSSFIVLGRTIQPIPFGAPDGEPTHLFFLLACPDDRLHLHTLARLCLMAQKTNILEQLQQAADAESMYQSLIASEAAVLEGSRPAAERNAAEQST
jgi:mannitol/fructose-specific phosphotransferase system IIA component (Ntr-type)